AERFLQRPPRHPPPGNRRHAGSRLSTPALPRDLGAHARQRPGVLHLPRPPRRRLDQPPLPRTPLRRHRLGRPQRARRHRTQHSQMRPPFHAPPPPTRPQKRELNFSPSETRPLTSGGRVLFLDFGASLVLGFWPLQLLLPALKTLLPTGNSS